jgi:predicted amidohydrolase
MHKKVSAIHRIFGIDFLSLGAGICYDIRVKTGGVLNYCYKSEICDQHLPFVSYAGMLIHLR